MCDVGNTGIYEIVCLKNGKTYIGSAVSFTKRWNYHKFSLRKGTHHSAYLQRSWNKYGESEFKFNQLALCEPIDLIETEQRFLDEYKPEFNTCETAGSTFGFRFSDESRAKMSARQRGKKKETPVSDATRAKLSAVLTGREFSEEHLANLRAAAKITGANRVITNEYRERMAEATRNRYASGAFSRERPPEYREKIAATLRGRKLTDEHRANVSASMLGKKRGPYNIKPKNPPANDNDGQVSTETASPLELQEAA